MIRTLLLVFALVVAVTSIDERFVQRAAKELGIKQEDVRTCASNANVTDEDVSNVEVSMNHYSRTRELEDTAVRVGCLNACLMQKAGMMSDARWNIDKVKEVINSTLAPSRFTEIFQVMDTCVNRVKNETKECEAGFKFVACMKELQDANAQ